ncbi:hypothetical protein jhhlp_001773 [Lomentospora prolificans]|uniref:Uncharacterized protein n=1 Tax=Lomentospora prolificans TaxID=41688 RepID=A0A2N3NGZ1_9PEZI|nr:hypothetical protein jhhlp_001773 [Lomentospora prolificans]
MDWDVEMDEGPHLDGTHSIADYEDPKTASNPAEVAVNDSTRRDNTETQDNVVVPTKLHIRGLDILTTEDIKTYVRDHTSPINRVEWIDDTSANIVFSSEDAAQDALSALSAIPIADPTQLPILECIPAKPYGAKPEVQLQIRFAVSTDKKQVGASSRSRFYLLHPEYDPEERRRHDRSRYRDRDSTDTRRYRDSRRRHDFNDTSEYPAYDETFYDDKETGEDLHSRSRSDLRNRDLPDADRESRLGNQAPQYLRERNETKELFPQRRRDTRLRSRSASPRRDVDKSAAGEHSHRNRARAMQVKHDLATVDQAKELFPSKLSASSAKLAQLDQLESATKATSLDGADSLHIRGVASQASPSSGFTIKGASSVKVKELFPSKFGGSVDDDLFPDKLEGRNRRRQKAEDLFH